MLSGGTATRASSASRAILKLLSGSSGPTQRSSLQKRWICGHGSARRASASSIARGVFPPESATANRPRVRTAASHADAKSSAAQSASAAGESRMRIERGVKGSADLERGVEQPVAGDGVDAPVEQIGLAL